MYYMKEVKIKIIIVLLGSILFKGFVFLVEGLNGRKGWERGNFIRRIVWVGDI